MWGCVLSAMVTFPLVFGWVHFKLEGDLRIGLMIRLSLESYARRAMPGWHFTLSTSLQYESSPVVRLRFIAARDRGAIALSNSHWTLYAHAFDCHLRHRANAYGLSLWLHGYMYHFIALTHQASVIMTLFCYHSANCFMLCNVPLRSV
jgi:hypothetical protein